MYLRELKRIVTYLLLCVAALLGGCEKVPDGSVEVIVASKQSYVFGENGLPEKRYILREATEGSEWQVVDLRYAKRLDYQHGWEYSAFAHEETYEPEGFPQFREKFWWEIDELIEKVQKETEVSEDIYIYTYGSPWGFDPRDPMLTYLLDHYKEVLGPGAEIVYPEPETPPTAQ